MFKKLRRFGLLVTAFVLIGIGYTNFSSGSNNQKNYSSNSVAASSTNNIGDVQLVSSSSAIVENEEEISNIVDNEVFDNGSNINSDIDTENISNSVNNYFTNLKMERSEMYSKSLETYQKIIDNETVSSEQKSIAIQEIEKISNIQNAIQVAEELIKLKGFDDVVIYSANDKISVIVRVAVLSDV